MPLKAILFDFDDTLSHEAGSFQDAVRSVAETALVEPRIPFEPLFASISRLAREEWRASEHWRTPISLGVGWSEMFSGGFRQGEAGTVLEAESQRIRNLVWQRALTEAGIEDEELVARLSHASLAQGTGPHRPYPGAEELLSQIAARFPLALVTNGNPDIQRRKLTRSGLEGFFHTVVVSGDAGLETLKPDPATFRRALSDLGIEPEHSAMVGNDAVNDIHGAASLGIRTVWVNHEGHSFEGPTPPDHEIRDLRELPTVLGL